MGQICFILIGRNLKWSVLIGRALIAARGATRNPLLSLKCGAPSDWSRAVSPPMGRYELIVSTDLIGREQFHNQRAQRVIPYYRPLRHYFAVILSPGALRVKCVDGSDWSRAVT